MLEAVARRRRPGPAKVAPGGCLSCLTYVVVVASAVLLSGCGNQDKSTETTTTSSTGRVTTTTTTTSSSTVTTAPAVGYRCKSSLVLDKVNSISQKGLCLDDTTFSGCPEQIPTLWPHTGEPVTSLRLFKAWSDDWGGSEARQQAWDDLRTFVLHNNAKVLMGTMVSCNNTQDDLEWQRTLELMQFLGKDSIMGVGIGNEMDIFWQKPESTPACIKELWSGHYWETFQQRVEDLDRLGFQTVPVTVVWAMSVLANFPFLDRIDQATVKTFVTNAYAKYGKRWVWTFNVYGIWDRSMGPDDPAHPHECEKAIELVTGDYNKKILQECRKRMKVITGNDDDPMWVGETGWSTPAPDGIPPLGKSCPAYCSPDTFRRFYENFMSWELDEAEGVRGPDHAFYFTMRNSLNGRAHEGFGLIKSCGDSDCKLAGNPSMTGIRASPAEVDVVV